MRKYKIHKWVDLSELPKDKIGRINWNSSTGCKFYFEYDDVKGFMEIIGRDMETNRMIVEYNDKTYKISYQSISECSLGSVIGKITKEFKIKIGTLVDSNDRDLIIVDREYRPNCNGVNLKWYKYKCNKCGWTEGWIEEKHLLEGNGCGCCSSRTVVKGINDIATTEPWMVKYFVNPEDAYKYTSKSHKKVKVKCPDCDRIKATSMKISELNRYNSIGCSCSDNFSYPEKFMFNVLEQLQVDFICQLSKSHYNWCERYRYDFYDKNMNVIIETHGSQHYLDKGGLQLSLAAIKENDRNKKILALSNGVCDYIEINCMHSNMDYMKNSILNSKMAEIYNMDNIDWYIASEYATKNIAKEICEDYNNSKDTLYNLSDKYKLATSTISRYLREGTKLGWCNYLMKNQKVQVEVIETGDVYGGIRECAREFNIKYGVQFNSRAISDVVNGLYNSHKGYHFRRVDDS